MTDTKEPKPGPIEVWLSKKNIEVTCRVVHEDESVTYHDDKVDSLSMRGAQREVTGWLISWGYTPAGRWETEDADYDNERGDTETSRLFKPGPNATAV